MVPNFYHTLIPSIYCTQLHLFESIHVFGFRYFIRRQIRPQHFRTKIQTFRTLCSLQAIYVSRCVSSYDESNQCASKGRGFLISRPIRMQDNSLTVNRLAKSGQERIELLQDYISTYIAQNIYFCSVAPEYDGKTLYS